jgi:hypothetical protein
VTELLSFLLAAAASAGFVALTGWVTAKMGGSEPARGSWVFFTIGGVLLLLALVQRSAGMFGGATGVLGGTSALVWWSTRRSEHRDQEARSDGSDLGLAYQQESTSTSVRDLAIALTSAGDHNKLRRVLSGNWRGNAVTLFDYYYEATSVDGPTLQWNFNGALVRGTFNTEPIVIRTETLLTRLSATMGNRDLELGDEAFDRLYNVRSNDPAAVHRILGSGVRSWLTENGRDFNFLIARKAVLCMAKEGTASRPELLELTLRFRDLVSKAAATSPTVDTESDSPEAQEAAGEVEPDQASTGPGEKIAVGFVIAIVAALALGIGSYVLFYMLCATGQGCL